LEAAEILDKPDKRQAIPVRVSGSALGQRIAPGECDLKKAGPIEVGEEASGDRLLVTVEPGATDLRHIAATSVIEIAEHDEADRLDSTRRGISGIAPGWTRGVGKGDTIALSIKAQDGAYRMLVAATPKTWTAETDPVWIC
jgi:hypothetical protein